MYYKKNKIAENFREDSSDKFPLWIVIAVAATILLLTLLALWFLKRKK